MHRALTPACKAGKDGSPERRLASPYGTSSSLTCGIMSVWVIGTARPTAGLLR